ncbi:MAG: HEAT repeat domain-containing protein [Planctomycetota bacterium]|jgi:HEAT repeat protein
MRTTIRATAVLVLTGLLLSAGARAETLTNEDIMDMVKAGLSETVVVKKIKTSECNFDVSAKKLVELKKADVPESIIDLMLDVYKQQKDRIKAGVQVAIQGFKDLDAKQHERSLRALVRMGAAAISEIVRQGLANEHPKVRAGCTEAVGKIGHRDGLEPIMEVLVDREQPVRAGAASALRHLVPDAERDRIYKRLTAILTDIEKPGDGVILAFGHLGMKQALPEIRRIARGDTSPRMREVAVAAIGMLRDAESLDLAIKRMLDDRNGGVRVEASKALALIGNAKAVMPMIKAFERYPQDRRFLVGPMARFRHVKVVETLIEALEDDDARVKDLSWEALKMITGESMKKEKGVWSEWWELDGKRRFQAG